MLPYIHKSDSIQNLGAALAKAQSEMPAIEFDAKNPFLRNSYASLKAVISGTRPVLSRNGLAITQFPVSNADGISDREGPTPVGKTDELIQVKTHRLGPNAVGITSLLVHSSGEFIAETLMLPLGKEKGKSDAQMAGSVLTYLRRYAWSSICGIYADEDTDGNEPPESRGQAETERFEDLKGPQARQGTSAPSSPPATNKAAASPTAAAASPQESTLVSQLRHLLGANEAEFVRCLQNRPVNDKGQLVLAGGKDLNELSDGWAKFFVSNFENELAKVEIWCSQNPPAATKPVEVPRDANIDPHSPSAAWRQFKMPYGKHQGTPLEKLDKKYLFGLWANQTVEETYNGKPRPAEKIAEDRVFRTMLDEAGKHYEFSK